MAKQNISKAPFAPIRSRRLIRVGYVPLMDSAPLIVAKTNGFFEKYGVEVDLVREIGWATVREKIRHGELECANAPASMVFELSCGMGVIPHECITGIVTAHHGNAIILSNELWEMGVRDAFSFARLVRSLADSRRFTMAGVLVYSSQNYLMRKWLRQGGVDPDRDVDMVMIPPPQVHLCLKAGHLDGFCVAEPWGSVAIAEGFSWSPQLTADLDPNHPEKVFLVRSDFDAERHDEHVALVAALRDSAAYCDDPANREDLVRILAHKDFLNIRESVLRNALVGPYSMGYDRFRNGLDVIRFSDDEGNRPSLAKGRWALDEIFQNGLSASLAPQSDSRIRALYREDIFQEAEALRPLPGKRPVVAEEFSSAIIR